MNELIKTYLKHIKIPECDVDFLNDKIVLRHKEYKYTLKYISYEEFNEWKRDYLLNQLGLND